jgi:hypothetical protein
VAQARLVRVAAAFALTSALASPASAQGGYVGAFLVGDVVRLDQYDSRSAGSGGGEALGFGLRLGTPIGGPRWGVELEFVRPGEITSDESPAVVPLAEGSYSVLPERVTLPTLPPDIGLYDPLLLPRYSYTYRSTARRTTVATSLWVRQEISPRFSLAYLGGMVFGRTQREVEVTFLPIRSLLPIGPSLPIAPSVIESIDYGVGPMAGVEGRIRLGGQVDLVPGLRLLGVDSGWVIRPAVGLAWVF